MHRPIPVEVVPFARPTLERELALEGFRPVLRPGPDGAAFRTDNGNEILDLTPAAALSDPAATDRALRAHIGIVETGLFVGMARRVYVGHADGRVDRRGPGRPATA